MSHLDHILVYLVSSSHRDLYQTSLTPVLRKPFQWILTTLRMKCKLFTRSRRPCITRFLIASLPFPTISLSYTCSNHTGLFAFLQTYQASACHRAFPISFPLSGTLHPQVLIWPVFIFIFSSFRPPWLYINYTSYPYLLFFPIVVFFIFFYFLKPSCLSSPDFFVYLFC